MAPEVETQTTASTATRPRPGWFPGRVPTEQLLWTELIVVMALDVLTTGIGLERGLTEGNPVMAAAIQQAGLGGLVLVKTLVVASGVAARTALPQHRYVIPLGLLIRSFVTLYRRDESKHGFQSL
jgi:hypothetical protein